VQEGWSWFMAIDSPADRGSADEFAGSRFGEPVRRFESDAALRAAATGRHALPERRRSPGLRWVLACEGKQSLQNAHAFGSALLQKAFRPSAAMGPEKTAAFEEIIGAALDHGTFARVDMRVVRRKAAGFGAHVNGDRFEPLVENADQPRLGPQPHVATDVLRRDGIERMLIGDVAVAMDRRGASSKHGNSESGNGRNAGCSA